MSCLSSYFFMHGRLKRGTWFLRLMTLAVFCMAFGLLAQQAIGSAGEALFAAVFLYGAMAVSVQRLHDQGRSGHLLWILLIPALGPLWVFVTMCRLGTAGGIVSAKR